MVVLIYFAILCIRNFVHSKHSPRLFAAVLVATNCWRQCVLPSFHIHSWIPPEPCMYCGAKMSLKTEAHQQAVMLPGKFQHQS